MNYRKLIITCFALVPLGWLVGVDQVIWYLILLAAFLQICSKDIRISVRIGGFEIATIFMLLAIGISCFALIYAPPERVLTYLRDTISWLLFFVVLVTYREHYVSKEEIRRLIGGVVLFIGFTNLVSLAVWFADLRFSFMSPISQLLPSSLVGSDFGQTLFKKSLLRSKETYLFGVEFVRVKSLFLFPNTYALALEIAIPFTGYMCYVSNRHKELAYTWLYAFFLVVGCIGLFASFSRSVLVTMFAGGFITLYFWGVSRFDRLSRLLLTLVVFFICLLGALIFLEEIHSIFDLIVYARGPGSAESRWTIFVESLRALMDNPLGYATQQDIPEMDIPPLGSHSTFIAIGFKYGVVGVFAYLYLQINFGHRVLRGLLKSQHNGDQETRAFFLFATWAFMSVLLHQATIEINLDVTAFMLVMILWLSILLRTRVNTDLHNSDVESLGRKSSNYL